MTTDPNRPSDPTQVPPTPPSSAPPPPAAPRPAVDPDYATPPADPGYAAPPPAVDRDYTVPTADPDYAAPPADPGYAPPPVEAASYPPPADSGYGASPPDGAAPGFELAKATTHDRGIAVAAVLFLVALLLPWFTVSIEGLGEEFNDSSNGFYSGLLTFAWVLLIAAAVVALLPAVGSFRLPIPRAVALLGLTALALLLTIIAFLDVVMSGGDVVGAGGGVIDVSSGIGAWLGLLVAIGAVVLAVMAFRAQTSEEDATV